jgi:hypothetical protein
MNTGGENRFCDKSKGPTPSAKREELDELLRHLEILEERAADEIVPTIRASWEDQAEAVRALIGGLMD